MKIFLIAFLLGLMAVPLGAVTPMDSYVNLVAGDDDPGFQDGPFAQARFSQPEGLALDEQEQRLFVADRQNNRIRVIYLNQKNRVETLGGPGPVDQPKGSLDQMTLHSPQLVVYLPNYLLVYEGGTQSLKLIDLGQRSFQTLTVGMGAIWNMVYRAEDKCVYSTLPDEGQIMRFDLKTLQLSRLLPDKPERGQLKAICLHRGILYVADADTSNVYAIDPDKSDLNELHPIAQGDKILQMTFKGDELYALQSGNEPLVELLPEPRPVSLATPWGFKLSSTNPGYLPLLADPASPSGFTAASNDSDRFYLSMPKPYHNCVISVRDDHFGDHWNARDPKAVNRELTDFDYPAAKPAKTFRILVVGNSRVVTGPTALSDEEIKAKKSNLDNRDFQSPRVFTFAKQLEFLLNTQAALNGVDQHFEVLELGRPGLKLQFFANDQVPGLVKKYDVDLVLGFLCPTFEEAYEDYYLRALNGDGIPTGEVDPEYLDKPWKERLPEGAPKDLVERGMNLKLITASNEKNLKLCVFQDLMQSGDKAIRQDLVDMLGKPLQVLGHHLSGMKVASSGSVPLFKLFYVPDPDGVSNVLYESFWTDVCAQHQLDLMDLTEPYEALKYSFFPTTEACCHQHYTAYGNALIAELLTHYLPEKGWIPFTSSEK